MTSMMSYDTFKKLELNDINTASIPQVVGASGKNLGPRGGTVEYWIEFRMKQTKMYIFTLVEFILVDIWIHCCTKLK